MQHLHSAALTRAANTNTNTTSNHAQRRDGQYRTTDRVLQILLQGDLYRLRVESVASQLGMSPTTLRRRLRMDHTHYQFLLDRARQYRCEQALRTARLPGKCLADELGYLEVNSFYRAFRRWTGVGFSDWKAQRL
jgi:AraC-like DNA-binding protein|tara:strand:+ start:3019 stop:3423 length:405 start_codon:yes stop_codon:yes gene_type:complete